MLKWLAGVMLAIIGGFIGVNLFFLMGNYLNFDIGNNVVYRVTIYAAAALIGASVVYLLGNALFAYLQKKIRNIEKTLQKRSLQEIVIASFGLIIGLIIANLVSIPFLKIPLAGIILAFIMNIVIGYIGIDIALKKKDELSDIPFIFKKSNIKTSGSYIRPKILDTSVIIDGRIADICQTGFIEGPLVIPSFVLRELQHIADSSDGLKRNRGRRGLDILNIIQKDLNIPVKILDKDFEDIDEVDSKLLKLAERMNGMIITNDYNLNKIASFQGVPVLNINELANAVKPIVLPGEDMNVQVVKDGKENGQGIAYLDDGTMIVVDGGKKHIGESIGVIVTSVLQTPAGRMIFAKPKYEVEKAG